MSKSKTFLLLFIYTFLFVTSFTGVYMYFSRLSSEGAPQNIGGSAINSFTMVLQGFKDRSNLIAAFIIALLTSVLSIMVLKPKTNYNVVNAFAVTIIFTVVACLQL